MNYEQLSDFEINKTVAEALGIYYADGEDGLSVVVEPEWNSRDYCNNPSDAWPIIVENRMDIIPFGFDEWISTKSYPNRPYSKAIDENPLRAAMIVFLKMLAATGAEKMSDIKYLTEAFRDAAIWADELNREQYLTTIEARYADLEAQISKAPILPKGEPMPQTIGAWQPMETVPKVETYSEDFGINEVLLKFADRAVSVGYWTDDEWREPLGGEVITIHYGEPIGWMPL